MSRHLVILHPSLTGHVVPRMRIVNFAISTEIADYLGNGTR